MKRRVFLIVVLLVISLTSLLSLSSDFASATSNNIINGAPVAVDDSATVSEGGTVTTLDTTANTVLANDNDPDGDNLIVDTAPVNGPSQGSLTLNSDGTFSYSHDSSETTSDSFVYQVCDDSVLLECATASVNITVNPVNDPPTVSNVPKSGNEDNNIAFASADFTGHFSDAEGDSLAKIQVTSSPADGILGLSGTPVTPSQEIATANLGALTFTPAANWNGATSFGWNGHDGTVYAASGALVNITINAVNDAPIAVNDSGAVNEDGTMTTLDGGVSSVLANDSDPEEDNLIVDTTPVSGPSHGSLTLNSNGTFSYSHDGGETTSDSFVYQVCDDGVPSECATASVSITVNPVNDSPLVSNIPKSGNEDNNITFALSDFTSHFSDAEGDSLVKIQVTSLPAGGALFLSGAPVAPDQEIAAANLGALTFTPAANWNGATSFGWNGHDGTVYATTGALVNITVNAVNDAPTVSNVSKTGNEDIVITFAATDFTSHFNDVEGDSLAKIQVTSLPANGTLALSGTPVVDSQEITTANLGNLTFAPDADWNGATGFGWNGHDGMVYATSGALVNITVNAVNDAPTVSNVSKIGNEDGAVIFTATDFTIQFSDVDGNSLTKIRVTSLPANGILALNGTPVVDNQEITTANLGNLTFTPDADWNGATSFGWRGHDGTVYSASGAAVNITIFAINDPPVIDLNGGSAGTGFTTTFVAGEGPVAIVDTDLTVTDIDDTHLNSATVTLTNHPDGLAEALTAGTSDPNIDADYDSNTGVLTLSGVATVTRYQNVLRGIIYNNILQDPTTTSRAVTFVANDGTDDGAIASSIVHIITPDIAIAKTPDSQSITSGDSANFTIVITNTGDVDLTNVTVTDPQSPDCDVNVPNTLEADEVYDYTCSQPNVTTDFLNEASVTGQHPLGGTVSDSDAAFVDVNNPNIAMAINPETQTLLAGGTASFNIIVVNTSNTVDLVNVAVSDPLVPGCNKTIGDLPATGNHSYTCSVTNVTTGFTNFATVTGVNPVNGGNVSDSDIAIVEVLALSVAINASPTTILEPGGPVAFDVLVTNNSSKNVTLTGLSSNPYGDLTNANNGALLDSTCASGILLNAEGGAYVCSFTAAVSGEPAAYTISVTAVGNGGDVSGDGSATVTITAGPEYFLYLPVTAKNYVAAEPNSVPCDAYSIHPNREYSFLSDDQEDWYLLDLASAGNLQVTLTDFMPSDGQLIVYTGASCNSDELTLLASNGESSTTRSINLGARPAGTYYIRVYSGSAVQNATLYKLKVTSP